MRQAGRFSGAGPCGGRWKARNAARLFAAAGATSAPTAAMNGASHSGCEDRRRYASCWNTPICSASSGTVAGSRRVRSASVTCAARATGSSATVSTVVVVGGTVVVVETTALVAGAAVDGGARGVVSRRGAARNDDRGQDGDDASHEMRLRGGRVYEDLTYEEQGHVGVITLRRPEARNALDVQDVRRARRCGAHHDRSLPRHHRRRPGVLLRRRREGGDGRRRATARRRQLAGARAQAHAGRRRARSHTDVPVVAAVNGAAVGLGHGAVAHGRLPSRRPRRPGSASCSCCAASCSDAPGLGRLAQLVGREKAAEMLFTGEVIDAAGGVAHRARGSGGSPRRAAAHGARRSPSGSPRTRRSPCKRSSAGLRRGPRSRLERARRVGVVDPGRAVPDRGPPRGRARRSSRSARRNFTGADGPLAGLGGRRVEARDAAVEREHVELALRVLTERHDRLRV